MKWLIVLLMMCGVAVARPGGGQTFSSGGSHSYSSGGSHSYSGGSHSSSGGSHSYSSSSGGGGGGGGSGSAVGLIVFIGAAIVIFAIIALTQNNQAQSYTSIEPIGYTPAPAPTPVSLAPIMTKDPAFSRVIFEDFAYELFSAAHRARHDEAALAKLGPYLSNTVRSDLARRHQSVEQVVIGSLRLVRAFDAGYQDYDTKRIIVRIEANLANRSGSSFVVERWTFERATDVQTKEPPKGARTWPCPNCGAPWQAGGDPKTCANCGQKVEAGRLDWAVIDVALETETSVGQTLTGTVEEVGNDFPTVETGDPHADFQKLRTDDPAVSWPSFEDRVKLVYARLNDAWNAQDLTPVRGLVTHSLLQYLQYWIDEYKRQHMHNRLDDAKVTRIVIAAVTRDAYFDAITARVYATGHDYTLDAKDKVVGGSRDKDRDYTEYWTFVRSAKRRGATVTAPNCPNCGAPLAISDQGECTHCNAHVEAGEFDWVLSKIEQDDVYAG